MATEAELKALLNDPASTAPGDVVYGRNWNQWCQALMYQLTRLTGFPNPPHEYLSAMIARAASGTLNGDAAAAPAGAIHFWIQNHVGLSLGGERVLMASLAIDEAWTPNGTVGVTTTSRYTARKGLTYAGWALTDGGNVIPVTAAAPPALAAGQRLTKGAPVNRRTGPATTYPTAGAQLAANTVGNFTGFAHAQSVTVGGVTTDVWYKGISGSWFWAGLFTTIDGTNLTDLSSQFDAAGQPKNSSTTPAPPITPSYTAPYTILSRGIDVGSSQNGIDFHAAAVAGADWAVVKAGGANADLYVAPDYAAEVEAADAANLLIGHYFNSGQTDPVAAAIFFVANLHNFDVHSDVLMLDNEPYPGDKSGQLWNPGQAALFMAKAIELTGIDPLRVWHYAGASTYRSGVDWSPVLALWPAGQHRFGWAAFGAAPYPTDFSPSSAPDLQGSIPDWDIHQFSSNGQLGGKTVDMWASRLSSLTLFAEGTVTSLTPPAPPAPPAVPSGPVIPPSLSNPEPPVVPTPPATPATPASAVPSLGVVIGMIAAFFATLAALFFGH
jgi:hypothetical protein